MSACSHPEEWVRMDGKCLICGEQSPLETARHNRQEEQYRLQSECAHSSRHVFEGVCAQCGKRM